MEIKEGFLNLYERLLHLQNNRLKNKNIHCGYILSGHFRDCKRCKKKSYCWSYNVWEIDAPYRKACEDIRKIKERIKRENIPTKVNWTGILMAIRNQADREIDSYLRSVGISNSDWGKDSFLTLF